MLCGVSTPLRATAISSSSLCLASQPSALQLVQPLRYDRREFDLAATLLFVTSVLDLASGLALSLLVSVNLSFTFNLEILMESNLFTVLEAVKLECASLWG
jgi:hypothetical protein